MISNELKERYTAAKAAIAEASTIRLTKQAALSKLEVLHAETMARMATLGEGCKHLEHQVRIGVTTADDARQMQTELAGLNAGWQALCSDLAMAQADYHQLENGAWRMAKNQLQAAEDLVAGACLDGLLKLPVTDDSLAKVLTVMSLNPRNRSIGRDGKHRPSHVFDPHFGELLINRILKTEQNPNGYLPSHEDAYALVDSMVAGA